ncbi:nibrin isoform X1 [Heteronotia binoei]|uniref:nibrin isoform X1 n=1 Tax=Heteronotia binoei TaxID=13085 RepID=UPI00292EF790|nr:nibrin isoform X1 [Heteronotia binoei]
MWKLVPSAEPSPGEPHRLLIGIEYVVGRKNCAILIQDDQSISRSHAVLSVSHPPVNLSQTSTFPVLTLKDTSKYGTFVNGEKLPSGSSRNLQSGDRITFGVFESKYRIEYQPLVVCSSCLDLSQKNLLNQNVLQLGGHVVSEWKEECTHLVMVSVKVTVKTICALICGRPITKPEYFAELIKAIQTKQQLPKPESFHPPVDEPTIRNEKLDLAVCSARRVIFRGKIFLFLSAKQYAKLSPAITLGGGEAKLMTERTEYTASLAAPHICVIDVGFTGSLSDSGRRLIDTILTVLERKKYRTISEAEIGLAVIFASTERYCNPQASLDTGISSSSIGTQPSLSQKALVEETVKPTATGDVMAYVTDAELMDTCMEMFESHQEMPLQDQKGKIDPLDRTTVKETPAGTGTVNMGSATTKLNRQPWTEQSSLSFSPSKTPGYGRNREISSQHQSNSIKNYFQATTKKRERKEEGETSVSKYVKVDEKSSQASIRTQLVTSLPLENKTEESQKGQCTLDQKMYQSSVDMTTKSVMESSKSEGKNPNENIPTRKSATKKRKELDNLVEDAASLELVFATKELDWEEDLEDGDGKSGGMKKKRKVEIKGNGFQEGSSERGTVKLLQENEQALPASVQKQEIKKESTYSTRNELHDPDAFASDGSHLPSKLLLTEFRSLVVSQSRRGVADSTAKTNYGHLYNFKKFKKVPYPGAGQLPHIIGGSDLVAHYAKKNSEMEEWLRQEMEEQSRHAREESLADDLFRYNPHIKRR